MPETLTPGSILSMSSQAADLLLKLDDGDAALLYLHLLRSGSLDGVRWTVERMDKALGLLKKQGLAPAETAPPAPKPPAPAEPLPPEYTIEDINNALMDRGNHFADLCDEVERKLGKKLSASDLKELYNLFDFRNLSPEIILLLVNWCIDEAERKHGPGRKPSMAQIRREGSTWANRGIETIEQAEEYLRRMARVKGREAELLRLLDLDPRRLVPSEIAYFEAWYDMGFTDDVIRFAYERTISSIHTLNLNYMNGILKRWHAKNLHTLAAVKAGDRDPGFTPRKGRATGPSVQIPVASEKENRQAEEDLERLIRLMNLDNEEN